MKSLGETLKECRDLTGLTLRQVEEATEISNAYLSQLENSKIKKPSATVLYRLSCLYKVDIEVFLCAAGIIRDQPDGKGILYDIAAKAGQLTPQEEAQLLEYLHFLRHRENKLPPPPKTSV